MEPDRATMRPQGSIPVRPQGSTPAASRLEFFEFNRQHSRARCRQQRAGRVGALSVSVSIWRFCRRIVMFGATDLDHKLHRPLLRLNRQPLSLCEVLRDTTFQPPSCSSPVAL